jgi:hypothetical protein
LLRGIVPSCTKKPLFYQRKIRTYGKKSAVPQVAHGLCVN